jgi:two-component system sensor histidine kinase/response regulator
MNVDRERCFAAGMNDYLPKPLTIAALSAVLAQWDRSGDAITVDGVFVAPVEPERAVLDADVIARLDYLGKAAGVDLIGQLAVLFLADADVRVARLRAALADRDALAIVQSAHALCGASANLGAADLSRMCATLATPGEVGDLVVRMEMLEEIEAEIERVRVALAAPALTK